MFQLRQDHEELKANYYALKEKQKTREDFYDEKELIKTDITALTKTLDASYNQKRIKRPVRLLPASLFRYFTFLKSISHTYNVKNHFNFQGPL